MTVYDSCIESYKTTNHTWNDVVIVVLGVELSYFNIICYAGGKVYKAKNVFFQKIGVLFQDE